MEREREREECPSARGKFRGAVSYTLEDLHPHFLNRAP